MAMAAAPYLHPRLTAIDAKRRGASAGERHHFNQKILIFQSLIYEDRLIP
jgi:hypothetical protein